MNYLSESFLTTSRKVEPYVYRSLPDGAGAMPEEVEEDAAPASVPAPPLGIPEEEVERRLQAALQQGRQQAEAALREELQATLAAEREKISAAIQDFERNRMEYYQGIEREIVQLSLAIARKVLQRETEMDPLLLSGVVRVALDRLGRGASVHLRVPGSDVARWREFFDTQRQLAVKPVLVADASLGGGQCRLETELGETDLGLEVQMQEVEQAFASLLARRTGPDA